MEEDLCLAYWDIGWKTRKWNQSNERKLRKWNSRKLQYVYGNAYYHFNVLYIQSQQSLFQLASLVIASNVQCTLYIFMHKKLTATQYGISFAWKYIIITYISVIYNHYWQSKNNYVIINKSWKWLINCYYNFISLVSFLVCRHYNHL